MGTGVILLKVKSDNVTSLLITFQFCLTENKS